MRHIIYIAMMAVAFCACVEDKGSYENIPINEVEITGIEEEYTALSKIDVINISTQISGSIRGNDDSDYEYLWTVTSASALDKLRERISTEKDLSYKVDLTPGSYYLYFEVYDKKTELKWQMRTSLNVTGSTTTGFLLLGDKEDGTVGLDMIAMPAGRDTTVAENVFENTEGLIGAENLIFAGSRYAHQTLWMDTKSGSYALTNGSYFKILEDINLDNMFFSAISIKHPVRIKDMFPHQGPGGRHRSGMYRGYITEDGIFAAMIISSQTFSTPINRYESISEDLFTPYPLAFCYGAYPATVSNVIFYDTDNDCFVAPNSSFAYSSYCVKLSDKDGDPFPWDQKGTGRKLVYAENGFDGTYGNSYALMKDVDGNFFIYKFLVNSMKTPAKNGLYSIDLSVAQGFEKASCYTFSSAETKILYAVGNELWGYDYSRNVAAKLKTYENDIVYLSAEAISTSSRTDFILATYSQEKRGTVYKFELVTDPNSVTIKEREREIWYTNLKVKKIEWKNASDLADESNYF